MFKKKRGYEIGVLYFGFILVFKKMGVVDVRLLISCLNINVFVNCSL